MKKLFASLLVLILSGVPAFAISVTDTIGTSSRDFSTITLWEDSLSAHSGDIVTGEIYNDSVFDELVRIDDATPNGIILTVALGERHDGTAGTGARNVVSVDDRTFSVTVPNVTVKWLEFDYNGKTAGVGVHDSRSGSGRNSQNIYQNLIVHDIADDAGSSGIAINNGGCIITNCIVYDVATTGSGNDNEGIKTSTTVSVRVQDVMNNTVHGVKNNGSSGIAFGLQMGDAVDNSYQNNIIVETGGSSGGAQADYSVASPVNATVDHNAASDSTASGTGFIDNITTDDQFVSTTGGAEDFHLKNCADVIDVGVDLVTTPAGVNFDIDNHDRDADAIGSTWDMGADEFGVLARFAPATVTSDSTVGTVAWTNLTNVVLSDDSYASTGDVESATSEYLKVTNFGFSIPTGVTIDGIIVGVENHEGNSGVVSHNLAKLVKGGTIGSDDKTLSWPTSDPDAYTNLGGTSDLWGETWSVAEINASGFGFAVSASASGNSGEGVNLFVDSIQITVYFSVKDCAVVLINPSRQRRVIHFMEF